MKVPLTCLLALFACGTLAARTPLAARRQIEFVSVTLYECPRDSCEYTVRATLPGSLVRSRECLTLTLRFAGPDGELSAPTLIQLQGDASARREMRQRRRQGLGDNQLGEGKLRRRETGDLHLRLIQPGRESWTDCATHLQIEQELRSGRGTSTVPAQRIEVEHVPGFHPERTNGE